MKRLFIYTDGGARPNPGKGAFAFVVLDADRQKVHEHSEAKEQTTNNQMELTAVIRGLQWCFENHPAVPVTVITDSQYVQLGITDWIHKWRRNGWKNSTGKSVLNRALWEELHLVDRQVHPAWEWTKGHADDTWNNHVDALCSTHF